MCTQGFILPVSVWRRSGLASLLPITPGSRRLCACGSCCSGSKYSVEEHGAHRTRYMPYVLGHQSPISSNWLQARFTAFECRDCGLSMTRAWWWLWVHVVCGWLGSAPSGVWNLPPLLPYYSPGGLSVLCRLCLRGGSCQRNPLGMTSWWAC